MISELKQAVIEIFTLVVTVLGVSRLCLAEVNALQRLVESL
mgnify:CR=1 FL=1